MEGVLSDIRIRGHRLELTIKDVGSFYVKDHLHTFSLKRVDYEELVWAKNELTRRPALKDLEVRIKESFFDVVQVDAPIEIAQSKCYTLNQLRNHLHTHPETEEEHLFVERMFDYLIQSPPKGRKPYTIDRLRKHLYAHPNVRRRHRHRIEKILRVLGEGWPINFGKGIRESKDKTPKVRIPSPLPEEFLRGEYSTYARKVVAPKSSIVELEDSLVREIKSGKKEISLEGRLRYVRMPTYDELKEQKIVFLDTEVPLYRFKEAEVSWAAMSLVEGEDIRDQIVFSLYETPSKINGCRTVKCANEGDLAVKITEEIRKFGAETFIAYNVPFDAIKLREAGKFEPGEDDEEPKKISSIPFFERIGIKGMNVWDPLAQAKKMYGYLPNRKLVVVAQHVLGEGVFGKSINYDQQEDLEWVCKGKEARREDVRKMLRNSSAEFIIASYVSGDTKVLPEIIQSKPFNDSLQDVAFVSQLFKIDPYLLLHDTKRIQIYLERKFFEKIGVYKDVVYPRFKSFINYENKVKGKLRRTIENKLGNGERGLVSNLCQAYLPLGRVLRQDLAWFFPDVKDLYKYIDQFRKDNQRSYYLTKLEDALAEWMWTDYSSYLYEKDKLKKDYRKYGIKDIDKFEIFWNSLANSLIMGGLKKKLNRSAIAQKDLRPLLTKNNHLSDCLQEDLSLRDLQQVFRQWCRVRQRNRILFGAYETGWETFALRLDNFCNDVKNYCRENGLEIAHVQGRHVFLTGKMDNLYCEESPLIPVDQIKSAYLTGKAIHYRKYGFYPGFKKKKSEPTYNLSILEMDVIGGFLESILSGNKMGALTCVWDGLNTLSSRDIPRKNLVRLTKSTELFKAYEEGEEINFYQWGDEAKIKVLKGEEFILKRQYDESLARFYTMEPFYEGKEVVYKKRFLMIPEELEPDWEMYEEKIGKRVRELVRPLLGLKTAKKFVDDALSIEPVDDLEYYLESCLDSGFNLAKEDEQMKLI